MSAHYSLKETDGVAVVRFLQDYVDPEELERLHALIEQAGHRRVLLDLEGVGFVSSSAFAKLLGLKQRVEADGGKLALCGLNPTLRSYAHFTLLDRHFGICDSREEAIAELMAAKPQAPLG